MAAARQAFDHGPWPRMTMPERAAVVGRLAEIYAARQGEMAEVVAVEMGSPITFLLARPGPTAARHAPVLARARRDLPRRGGEQERSGITVRREPVGVVAAVVPWNVPQFVVMIKLAPALVAGCTIVVKPAAETPLDSYLLAEMVKEAGIPDGVVNIVAAGREAGEHLVSHPDVDKVAFTGSTAAGRRIAAICGEQLKRCTLELGGKSAAIILDDCDLPSAMGFLSIASLMNNGQACIAQTRILASPTATTRLWTRSRGWCAGCGSATRRTRRPVSAHWSPSGSGAGRGLHPGGIDEGAKQSSAAWSVPTTAAGTWPDRLRRGHQRDAHRPRGDLRPGPDGGVLRGRGRRDPDRQRSDYGLAGTVWTADTAAASTSPRGCGPAPTASRSTWWIPAGRSAGTK